jgi:hypothetical protein
MLPKFFNSVLGSSGFAVMQNLAKASVELESYLSPRIIVGWLRHSLYGRIVVPTECPLTKLNKSGYGYSGATNIDGVDYSFSNSSEEHVAAVITIALGKSVEPVDVKDIDLARLAKTIDLLCKAAPKAPANQYQHTVTAQPLQPEEPKQPDLNQPATNKTKNNITKPIKSKIPKIPGVRPLVQKPIKITKSESLKKCDVCGQQMFLDNVFVGCICFSPLAKNCKCTVDKDNITITFDEEWDDDSVLALVGVLKDGR